MEPAHFNEFLSEKQKIEDFLKKLEIELNNCLEDFEKISLEKLNECNDAIKENEGYASVIGGDFYKDYINFRNTFDRFVNTYEEVKRFKMEITLEGFLDNIQLLRKDLF